MKELKEEHGAPLIAIVFPFVVLFIILLLGLGSLVIILAVLVIASIFGYLSSVTDFISSNYFDLTYSASKSLIWVPELDYISGFIVGAGLLSLYIYLTYYNARDPEKISQTNSFYGAIFAGSALMAMGRIVYFYGGEKVANTVQTGIIDIVNVFPIILTIMLFQSISRSDDDDSASFRNLMIAELSEDNRRDEIYEEMDKDIAKNNPLVKFFLAFLMNPIYVVVGLLFILLSAYSTFLIEYNLTQLIDLNWAYLAVSVLLSSYIYSALKGRKLLKDSN